MRAERDEDDANGPAIPDEPPPFDPDAIGLEYGERPPDVVPFPTRKREDAPPGPAGPSATTGLRVLSAAAFLDEAIPPPRWLCEQIVPALAIGFIAGAPKVFKSFLAMDLAMAMASGRAFCGRFNCPSPRRVLVVQFESSRAAFQQRLRASAARFGGAPAGLFVISNEQLVLEDNVAVGRLERVLDEIRPELLVLDPLVSITSGDENSAQEMGALVRRLRALRDAFSCAIAVVHHTNKAAAGAGAAQRSGMKLRGSSALYAAAEWALWVDRPDEDVPRVEVRVEQKEAEPRRPFEVEFREIGAELVVVRDEVFRGVTDNALIEAIVKRGGKANTQEITADLEAAESTVGRRLRQLESMRKIDREPGTGIGRTAAIYVVKRAPKAASAK